jgi:hypothetical protein
MVKIANWAWLANATSNFARRRGATVSYNYLVPPSFHIPEQPEKPSGKETHAFDLLFKTTRTSGLKKQRRRQNGFLTLKEYYVNII